MKEKFAKNKDFLYNKIKAEKGSSGGEIMYLTDLEIEKYLKESPYNYLENSTLDSCERKITSGKLVKTDLYSVQKFIYKLAKKLFKSGFNPNMTSEREFIMLLETLIQEKFKNITDEEELAEEIEKELKIKFSI